MRQHEIKQLMPIITAFSEGKEIQVLDDYSGRWRSEVDLMFNSAVGKYRIKPTPKIRPFRRGEIKCGDVVKRKEDGIEFLIVSVTDQNANCGQTVQPSYSTLLEKFTMADGSPCGKEEEE